MGDAGGPGRGFKLGSVHRAPVNALVRYPKLILLVAVGGVVLWLLTPELCTRAFYPTRCRGRTEAVSLAIVALGVFPYAIVRLRRRLG